MIATALAELSHWRRNKPIMAVSDGDGYEFPRFQRDCS